MSIIFVMNPEKVNSIYVPDGVDKGRVESPDLANEIAKKMDEMGIDAGLKYEKFAEEMVKAGRSILPEMSPEQIENCRIFYGLLEKNPELSELVMKDSEGGSYIPLVYSQYVYSRETNFEDRYIRCLYLHEKHGPIYMSFDSDVIRYKIRDEKGRVSDSEIAAQKYYLQNELLKLRLSFNPDDLETRPLKEEWLGRLDPGEVFDNDFIVILGKRRKLSYTDINIKTAEKKEKKGGIWKKKDTEKDTEKEKPLLNIGTVSVMLLDYNRRTGLISGAIIETLQHVRAKNRAIKEILE